MGSEAAARVNPGNASDVAGPSRRLFTALFPSDEAQQAIERERQHWAGLPPRLRPVPARMHVTLQFHDRVDAVREQAWSAALRGLRFDPFDISLVRAELWHAPRGTIAVLRAAPSPALDALHAATLELARTAGLVPDARPYKPHLTALRQAERVQIARLAAPIGWRVQAISLIWSDLQARPPCYRVLGTYPAR